MSVSLSVPANHLEAFCVCDVIQPSLCSFLPCLFSFLAILCVPMLFLHSVHTMVSSFFMYSIFVVLYCHVFVISLLSCSPLCCLPACSCCIPSQCHCHTSLLLTPISQLLCPLHNNRCKKDSNWVKPVCNWITAWDRSPVWRRRQTLHHLTPH